MGDECILYVQFPVGNGHLVRYRIASWTGASAQTGGRLTVTNEYLWETNIFGMRSFQNTSDEKNKKQSSVTPVRSETPGPLVRYFLLYERYSSYLRTIVKKHLSLSPVRSEIPGSQVRYVLWYECYNLYCRTIGKNKKHNPHVPHIPHVQPRPTELIFPQANPRH
jgi:hypothetical protein